MNSFEFQPSDKLLKSLGQYASKVNRNIHQRNQSLNIPETVDEITPSTPLYENKPYPHTDNNRKPLIILIVALSALLISLTLFVVFYDKHPDTTQISTAATTDQNLIIPESFGDNNNASPELNPTRDKPISEEQYLSDKDGGGKLVTTDSTNEYLVIQGRFKIITKNQLREWQRHPETTGFSGLYWDQIIDFGVCCTSQTNRLVCSNSNEHFESELSTNDQDDVYLLIRLYDREMAEAECWITCSYIENK